MHEKPGTIGNVNETTGNTDQKLQTFTGWL